MKPILKRNCVIQLVFSLLLLLSFSREGFAQEKYYDRWYFGFSVGIDFTQTPPQKAFGAMRTSEGCASICDPGNGALLFYTNGITIWNRNHKAMKNGQGLTGHSSSTQSALIVPKPGDPNIFYVFTTYAGPDQGLPPGGVRELNYSTVDMRGDGGLGEVIEKNIRLMQPTTEKLVGIRHCNGSDYWVIGHELESSRFFAWRVTAAGVSTTPVITDVGMVHTGNLNSTGAIGYLKASPDGKFLFSIVQQEGKGELFGFDNEQGVVGPRIATIPAYYGASFSPNSSLLFVAYPTPTPEINRYVVVLNGSTLDEASILQTKRNVVRFPADPVRPIRTLQIGPDRRIYVGVNKHVAVIDDPDLGGTFRDSAFFYEPPALIGDSISTNGLPNCIDGFLGSTPMKSCLAPIHAKFKQSDTVICAGETIDFTDESADDPRSWQWNFQGGNPVSSREQHPKGIRYDLPGLYQVRLIVSNGVLFDTATGRVDVRPKPEADAGIDRVLCLGDTAHLHGTGFGSYQWSPSAGLSCSNCADPVADPSETTVYYLTVTSDQGCKAVDSVTVRVLPQIIVTAPSDTAICLGESLQLTASGADLYEWSPAEGLSCTDCADPIATPTVTTTYSVKGSGGNGGSCFDYDSVTVVVTPLPSADAGADTAVCVGGSVRLKASGGRTYRWEVSPDLSCLDCADPIATPKVTTTYYVTVTNGTDKSCDAIDSVTVQVYSAPVADAGEDRMLCPGQSVTLHATGGVLYRWEVSSDLSCLDCADPIASPSGLTTYRVTVIDAHGCEAIDSVTIGLHPLPLVDAGKDEVLCPGESVALKATGGVLYQWDKTADLSCLDCADPVASPSADALYYVTVTDANGCVGRDSVRVTLRPFSVSLSPQQSVCPGDTIRLNVAGGVAWAWTPTVGLSCSDCPDPYAFPSATTTYYVTVRSGDGCTLTDSVQVRVRENPDLIHLRIGRDYKGHPGDPIPIAVEVRDEVMNSDIRELLLELDYDGTVMVTDPSSIIPLLPGTLLKGWSMDIVESRPGHFSVRLKAPPGVTLSGIGDLLKFDARLYLSKVQGTELPFRLTSPSFCFAFASEAGYAQTDSICGLNFRLIELSGEKYAAPIASPNPASERVRFAFGIGLDAPTRLEIFDASGRRGALLVDGTLKAGTYEVEWEVKDYPPGLYYCRLTSGDWSRTERVMIVR